MRRCETCQKAAKRGAKKKALLVNMPIIGTPFEQVGIDIVGPIATRSKSGNRFILVMCDYAMKYPEAATLPSIKARQIAEALMAMFCHVGMPTALLSEQSSNFKSELFSEVCCLMRIRKL